MTKKNETNSDISIRNLNALIALYLAAGDSYINKEKHRIRYRTILKAIVAKGISITATNEVAIPEIINRLGFVEKTGMPSLISIW